MPDITELGIRITLKDGQIVAQQITAIGDAGERTAQRVVESGSKIEATIARQADAARRYQESIERQNAALGQTTLGQEGLREAQARWAAEVPRSLAATDGLAKATAMTSQEVAEVTRRYQAMFPAQEAVTAATVSSGLAFNTAGAGLGRVRQGLTSLIARMTGTTPVIDRLGGSLLAGFGVGNAVIIGVLAGIAAVAFVMKSLETDADRLAKKVSESMKKVKDELFETQIKMGDLQLAAAKARVDEAEIAIASAQRARGGVASKADDAAGLGPGGAALEAARNQYNEANSILALYSQKKTAIQTAMKYEADRNYDEQLNSFLTSDVKIAGAREKALARYKEYGDEIARLAKSHTDNVRLQFAIQEHDGLGKELFAVDKDAAREAREAKRAADAAQRAREKAAAEKDAVDKMVAGFAEEAAASGRMLAATALGTDAAKRQAREEEVRLALAATGLTQGDALYDQVEKSIRQALANKETIKAITDARDRDAEAAKKAAEAAQKLAEKTAEIAKQVASANQHLSASIERDLLGALQKFTTGGITSISSFFKEFESLSIRMVEQFDSAMKRLNDTLAAALKAGVNTSSLEGEITRVEKFRKEAGIAASAFSGATAGYGVGASTEGNRGSAALFGTAAGAASGAMIGSVVPGVGTAIGAAVGAIAGFVGGIVGAGHAASLSDQEMKKLQETLTTSIKDVRAQLANDALGSALAQVQAQFVALRKAAEDAYATGKNEAQRNVVLADLAKLEAQRLQQVRDEFALKQTMLQQDAQVLLMRSTGRTAEADAMAFQLQQERVLRDLKKQGATDESIAAVIQAQVAEADKRRADIALTNARAQEDYQVRLLRAQGNVTGADDLSFRITQQREYDAAVKAGLNDATLGALALAQAAEAVKRAADLALQSSRAMEDLNVRILNATGNARAGSDAAFRNAQQREYQDAQASGRSKEYLALLTEAQVDEAIQRATQQAIADQTKVIQDASAREQAKFDEQIKAAQESLKLNQQQLQVAQQSAAELRRTADSLTAFQASLKLSPLSTLSPTERLAESKKQLDELFALAKGGDAKAGLAFGQSANAFLGESKSYNASSAAYGADFASVQAMTNQLQGKFENGATAAEQTVALLKKANEALQLQITALQDAKAKAAADAQAAIAALQQNGALTTAQIVAAIQKDADAATSTVSPLVSKLDLLAQTVSTSSASVLNGLSSALGENKSAVQAAALAQIVAVNSGANSQVLATLGTVTKLEETRLNSNVNASGQIAQLIASGGLSQLQITQLATLRSESNAAYLAQRQAVEAGASVTVQSIYGQIAAVNDAKFNTNARLDADIAAGTRAGTLTDAARQAIETARVDANTKADAQVAKLREQLTATGGTTTAVGETTQAANRITAGDSWLQGIHAVLAGAFGPLNVSGTQGMFGIWNELERIRLDLGTQNDAWAGGRIPQYAGGGDFSGGLRIVGERGPELEATGPSRIFSNTQLRTALSGGADDSKTLAALTQLVERQEQVISALQAVIGVSQAGAKATVTRLDTLIGETKDNTTVTRRGFERATT